MQSVELKHRERAGRFIGKGEVQESPPGESTFGVSTSEYELLSVMF